MQVGDGAKYKGDMKIFAVDPPVTVSPTAAVSAAPAGVGGLAKPMTATGVSENGYKVWVNAIMGT